MTIHAYLHGLDTCLRSLQDLARGADQRRPRVPHALAPSTVDVHDPVRRLGLGDHSRIACFIDLPRLRMEVLRHGGKASGRVDRRSVASAPASLLKPRSRSPTRASPRCSENRGEIKTKMGVASTGVSATCRIRGCFYLSARPCCGRPRVRAPGCGVDSTGVLFFSGYIHVDVKSRDRILHVVGTTGRESEHPSTDGPVGPSMTQTLGGHKKASALMVAFVPTFVPSVAPHGPRGRHPERGSHLLNRVGYLRP